MTSIILPGQEQAAGITVAKLGSMRAQYLGHPDVLLLIGEVMSLRQRLIDIVTRVEFAGNALANPQCVPPPAMREAVAKMLFPHG